METKFTKGEWVIDKRARLRVCFNDETIASCGGSISNKNNGEAEANAKLIAAAPTMFQALCEIAEGKGRYDTDKLRHAANCIEDMVVLAKEAIKKVTE